MTNQAYVGTIQYAFRDAMEKLGADRVAALAGVSVDTLYKATKANPERPIPDVPFSRIAAICAELLRAGHSEAFSPLLTNQAGEADEIRMAVLDMAATMGDIAEKTREATHRASPGGQSITRSEAAAIAESTHDMIRSAQTVIASLTALQDPR